MVAKIGISYTNSIWLVEKQLKRGHPLDISRVNPYISTHHYENIANYSSAVRTDDAFIKEFFGNIASSSNPEIKIDMSEWNVSSGLDWRNSLYVDGMFNTFERNGDVLKIGGPALFLRHSSANVWNNAFINFNNSGWYPAPTYLIMKFWRDHYAPNFIETTATTTVSMWSPPCPKTARKPIPRPLTPQPLIFRLPSISTTFSLRAGLHWNK
ncbi:hypothetical protein A2V82_07540 [candidate division KSB1 bacterium RBG_16_48_16]|nr:MAG: hypothetical protein A2V82_07540 [candidate division KSB1 bacterium RBG_16_48_16]